MSLDHAECLGGRCVEVVAYLRRKAEQCRRLAAEFLDQNDPAVKNLIAVAADFDARAQRRADVRFREVVQMEIKCID
jgi:hypothetical protein